MGPLLRQWLERRRQGYAVLRGRSRRTEARHIGQHFGESQHLGLPAVTNAAQPTAGIAANTYVTIKGNNLAATKRIWATADFGSTGKALPTALDGVSVTINGAPAFIYYISPVQINVLTPTDMPASGQVTFQVTNGTLTSILVNVTPLSFAPSFFLADVPGHLAATHANGAFIGSATSAPAGTPAAPGEVIVMYGNGFGATNPKAVNGQVQSGAAPLVETPVITIGGANATVAFAGLTATGLYQFNVTVPSPLPDGDAAVVAKIGGVSSRSRPDYDQELGSSSPQSNYQRPVQCSLPGRFLF